MKQFITPQWLSVVLCLSILHACVDEVIPERDKASDSQSITDSPITTRSSDISPCYDTLPNPYALEVMQEVYDIYSETEVTLEATDLYVKFKPTDSLQLHRLIYDYNLELFDYPLDIVLEENEIYVNPDIPETDLAWLYTTVSSDFDFPDDISYEILRECYIPAEDETVGIPTRAGEVNVEEAAFNLLGYNITPNVETRCWSRPQGNIFVHNNSTNTNEPLKGVKVRCNVVVKLDTVYTDELGHYTMNKSFFFDPCYTVVFENTKGFQIWDNYGPISSAKHYMGSQSNSGHSATITEARDAWDCAVVNNSAYEYYKMCEQTGILPPPDNLKIWIWDDAVNSSAPLLRNIADPLRFDFIWSFMGSNISISISTEIGPMLRIILPDITIGTASNNNTGGKKTYKEIYEDINHELAHASHFNKVGSPFWSRYIEHIVENFGYGNPLCENAQLCAIGEMWGYYMGYQNTIERFGTAGVDPLITVEGWIYPQVFFEIDSLNILSKRQIYECLLPEVDTYDELVVAMARKLPHKATDIMNVFNNYPGINHNIILSEYDNIVYDTFCTNRNIASSETISGENILVQNTTVSNDATLTINSGNYIIFNKPFIIEKGSHLIVNRAD